MSKDAEKLVTIERPGEVAVRAAWQMVGGLLAGEARAVARTRAEHVAATLRLGCTLLQVRRQVEHGAYLHVVDAMGLHKKTAQRAVRKVLEIAQTEPGALKAWITRERLAWAIGKESDERPPRVTSDERKVGEPGVGSGICDKVSHLAAQGQGKPTPRPLPLPEVKSGISDMVSHGCLAGGRAVSAISDMVSHNGGRRDPVARAAGVELEKRLVKANVVVARKGGREGKPHPGPSRQMKVGGRGSDLAGQMTLDELFEAAAVMRAFADRVAAGEVDAATVAAVVAAMGGAGAAGGGGGGGEERT